MALGFSWDWMEARPLGVEGFVLGDEKVFGGMIDVEKDGVEFSVGVVGILAMTKKVRRPLARSTARR